MKAWIAHVPYEHRGGEDVHVEVLARAYQALGIEVEWLPADRKPPAISPADALKSIFSRESQDFDALWAKSGASFVHLHNAFPLLGPRFFRWAASRKIPVLMTVHNHRFFCTNGLALREGQVCKICFSDRGPALKPLLYNCNGDVKKTAYHALALSRMRASGLYKKAVTRFIAPSPYIRDELLRFGVDSMRVAQVMNPVSVESDAGNESPVDAFYAGRLSPEKGVSTILEAARTAPDLVFAIAGDGPLRGEVERAAGALKNLRYLRDFSHARVLSQIRASRTGVLASTCNEILPTFVLECFNEGRVCVVSDLESTRWLSKAPWPGVAAKPGDAMALVSAIRTAIDKPGPSESEISSIRGVLSFERFTRELSDVVNGVVRGTRP